MTSYRLVDHGYSFKKIMHGKRWVGRVGTHVDGGYVGTIGKNTVKANSEVAAFEEVCAQQMGYANANELKSRNSRIRTLNRHARSERQEIVNQMLGGDFSALDRLMEIKS